MGIILSYLKKVGAEKLLSPVYWGVAFGIVASVAAGALFMLLSVEFDGPLELAFEGTTMFLAAAILTTMILWMRNNSKAYSEGLKQKVGTVLHDRQTTGLALLAFVSIFREGVETVLFLGSASFTSTGIQVLIGGTIGLTMALVVSVAIMKYSVRLDLRTFFSVTGVLLVLFAAGLVAHGIHEFEELGVVPPVVEHVWDINWLVDDQGDAGRLLTALFGYNGNPSLVEVLGYIGYWLVVAFWVYRDATASFLRRVYAAVRPA